MITAAMTPGCITKGKEMSSFRSLFIAAILALFSVSPASAAVILAKFSGRIAGGYDNTGLSGAGGGVVGLPFEVAFVFDLNTVGATFSSYPGTHALTGTGPYSLGTTYVTVGAHTWELPKGSNNQTYRSAGSAGQPFEVFASSGTNYSYVEAFVLSLTDPFTTLDLAQSLTYSSSNLTGGSQFWFYYGSDEENQILVYNGGTPATVTVSVVPEPGTWVMMIAGFGAMGLMVRNSRRRNALMEA